MQVESTKIQRPDNMPGRECSLHFINLFLQHIAFACVCWCCSFSHIWHKQFHTHSGFFSCWFCCRYFILKITETTRFVIWFQCLSYTRTHVLLCPRRLVVLSFHTQLSKFVMFSSLFDLFLLHLTCFWMFICLYFVVN